MDNSDLPVSFIADWLRWPSRGKAQRPSWPGAARRELRRRADAPLCEALQKLHGNVAADIDAAVETVAGNPSIGERKRDDLADLLVFRFRSQGQLYLLGYTLDNQVRLVYLEAIGPHENFYRDINHG